MLSSLSDTEDQSSSADACFYYIPAKINDDQSSHNANPESNFYIIKNTQQSSHFSYSITNVSRSENPRTIFTIVPPMPQDVNNVR